MQYSRLGDAPRINASFNMLHSAFADFNGDGYMDAVTADLAEGMTIFTGSGAGELDTLSVDRTSKFIMRIITGDFDRDGDNDIFALGIQGKDDRLYFNDGKAKFTDVTNTNWVSGGIGGLRLRSADLDGDGDQDIISASLTGLAIVINNAGRFVDETAKRLATNSRVYTFQVADANKDGRPDIFTSRQLNTGGWRVELLLQSSTGSFGMPSTVFDSPTGIINSLALGDADADGDVDLFVGRHNKFDQLLLQSGTTWTNVSSRIPQRGLSSQEGCRFVDFDEDGDLDLIVVKLNWGAIQDRTRLYANDGKANFVDTTLKNLSPESGSGVPTPIVDFDHDGDLDLAVWETSPTQRFLELSIEKNLSRQAQSPATVSIGTPLSLDFYARAGNAPAGQLSLPLVNLSRNSVNVPVPGFGMLGVGLTGIIVLPTVPHAATTGKANARLPIPHFATLIGKRVYVQSLVLHAPMQPSTWRLTNVSATTITR